MTTSNFPHHRPAARRFAISRRLFVSAVAIPILSLCLLQPGVAQDKKLRIGLTVPTLVNPFFVGMDRGVREECQKLGYELIAPNANNDMATQANQMEDLITKKVDLIIICPINAEAIVPVVKKANAAKIPVVALDRGSAGGETGQLHRDK
jgi:ABC-type sugar transport system substrate-binding protein